MSTSIISFKRKRNDSRVRHVERTTANVVGQLVYAIGDVHGCYDLLRKLLAQVTEDFVTRARGRRPVLIFSGDYVDRGPDSAKVLDALVWLRRRGEFDLHLLKGNHEEAFLSFIGEPESGADWLRYGGEQTLTSYGVRPPDAEDRVGCVDARDELLDNMPASHLRLLQRLKLLVSIGDYAFAHAGVRPGVPIEAQTEKDLLWIRREFLDAPGAFPKVIVHGHSWNSDRPEILNNRIGIDTGAYETGVLTAVCLEDEEVAVFQAGRSD